MLPDPVVSYRVRFDQPARHVYQVELSLERLADRPFTLSMPVWTPGHYLVVDYSGHVFDVLARRPDGSALGAEKTRKDTWRVDAPGPGGAAIVSYRVYAHSLTVSTSHLTADHAYWNGATMFMALDGRNDLPAEVKVEVPQGWRLSTGLPSKPGEPHTLVARSFDLLVDSPVEVGSHDVRTFEAMGAQHEVAIAGDGNIDRDRFVSDLRRIVEAQGAIFGGVPYERYAFLVHLTEGGWGGLEHLYSTTCDADRFSFRPESAYRNVLDLMAHEFFHLWNVKRIHPEALGPFDYQSENYTTLLWAMEGLTSYYAWHTLLRAGLIDKAAYLKGLGEKIHEYERTPGRLVQSAADSSFDTWSKFYRPDDDGPNRTISYYLKGELLGVGLELTLRRLSGGERGLDDVMRLLWQEYGRAEKGFPEGAWREAAERVAGGSMADFFGPFVERADAYDLDAMLRCAGLRLDRTRKPLDPDAEPDDAAKAAGGDRPAAAWLGLATKTREGRVRVAHVMTDGPCADSGVSPGDELIGLDGYRVDPESLEKRLKRMEPGRDVVIDYASGGQLRRATVRSGDRPPDLYKVVATADAGDLEKRIHQVWLGEAWAAPEKTH